MIKWLVRPLSLPPITVNPAPYPTLLGDVAAAGSPTLIQDSPGPLRIHRVPERQSRNYLHRSEVSMVLPHGAYADSSGTPVVDPPPYLLEPEGCAALLASADLGIRFLLAS